MRVQNNAHTPLVCYKSNRSSQLAIVHSISPTEVTRLITTVIQQQKH